jgi:hypothetical protein
MDEDTADELQTYRNLILSAALDAHANGAPTQVVNAALIRLGISEMMEESHFARYTARVQVLLDGGQDSGSARERVMGLIAENDRRNDRRNAQLNYFDQEGHVSVPDTLEWQVSDETWLPDADYWRHIEDRRVSVEPIDDLAALKGLTREVFRELALEYNWNCSTTWSWWNELDLGPLPVRVIRRAQVQVTGTVTVNVLSWQEETGADCTERFLKKAVGRMQVEGASPVPGSAVILAGSDD